MAGVGMESDLLQPAGGHSFCEWKGQTSYFAIRCGKTLIEKAAWSYEEPSEALAEVPGRIGCYPGRAACFVDAARVRPQAGGFYGGPVTSEFVGPFNGNPRTGGGEMSTRFMTGIFLLMLTINGAAAYDLGQYQWRHRLLFLIASHSEDPGIATQQQWMERRWEALLDRDVIVFQLFSDQGLVGDRALPAQAVRQLRQQLEVAASDRLVVLIGKDGGIKRRAALDSDLRDILLQIDAMPMRRDEMEAKTEAGVSVTAP